MTYDKYGPANASVSNYNDSGNYRMPKKLNVTLQPYAILGVDGKVMFIRPYPPIKPKDLHPAMKPIPNDVKVKPGWFYRNGGFHET